MHTLALQLAPVLAAEKSKVPFYIAGGLLVVWALVLSLGIGMRKPDFPGSAAGQRGVVAISAVLVLAAVATAVLTSSVPAKGTVPPAQTQERAPVTSVSAPVEQSAGAARRERSCRATAPQRRSRRPARPRPPARRRPAKPRASSRSRPTRRGRSRTTPSS